MPRSSPARAPARGGAPAAATPAGSLAASRPRRDVSPATRAGEAARGAASPPPRLVRQNSGRTARQDGAAPAAASKRPAPPQSALKAAPAAKRSRPSADAAPAPAEADEATSGGEATATSPAAVELSDGDEETPTKPFPSSPRVARAVHKEFQLVLRTCGLSNLFAAFDSADVAGVVELMSYNDGGLHAATYTGLHAKDTLQSLLARLGRTGKLPNDATLRAIDLVPVATLCRSRYEESLNMRHSFSGGGGSPASRRDLGRSLGSAASARLLAARGQREPLDREPRLALLLARLRDAQRPL